MSLYDKIVAIYPELTVEDFHFMTGVILIKDESDGFGPYIAKWEHPTLAQPSDADLGITRNAANVIIEGEVIEAPTMMIGEAEPMDMSQFRVELAEDTQAGGA